MQPQPRTKLTLLARRVGADKTNELQLLRKWAELEGHIVLITATTGIAAPLLENGFIVYLGWAFMTRTAVTLHLLVPPIIDRSTTVQSAFARLLRNCRQSFYARPAAFWNGWCHSERCLMALNKQFENEVWQNMHVALWRLPATPCSRSV